MSTSEAVLSARERGNDAFKRGAWPEAEAAYSEAIFADPDDSRAWCNRALVYLKLQKPILALGDAVHVCSHFKPMSIKALVRRAEAFEVMQVHAEAIESYQECLRIVPYADTATRRDIEGRLFNAVVAQRAATAAHQKELQEALKRSPRDVQVAKYAFECGEAALPGSYRDGEGGPRHPAVVTEAFSFTTDFVKLQLISPEKGMGVVATRDIPAHTLVHVNTPLLAVSMPIKRTDGKRDCYHCTRPVSLRASVPCECERVYCSKECKEAAVAMYHGPLCGMADGKAVAKLERLASEGMSGSSRFILFMWKMLGAALVHSKRTGEPLVRPADVPPFSHLRRLSDLTSADDTLTRITGGAMPSLSQWEILRGLLTDDIVANPALSIRWVIDAFMMLAPNAYGLNADGRASYLTLGVSVMGAGSFFNHGCNSNVSPDSDMDRTGSKVHFVTKRLIKKGEELTINYIDVPWETPSALLKSQLGGICRCDVCIQRE